MRAADAQCSQQVPGFPAVTIAVSRCFTNWDSDGAGPEPASLVAGAFALNSGGECVLRLHGDRWIQLGDTFNLPVQAMIEFNGRLIVARSFTKIGNVDALRIAQWNGTAWEQVGAGFSGPVDALAVYRGELIAGGSFSKSGEVSARRLAAWDGSAWRGLQSTAGGEIFALLVRGSELIVGGSFTTIDGVVARNIAAFDGSAWHGFGTGLGSASSTVYCLTEYLGRLIAGGSFGAAGSGLAAWDGSKWQGIGVQFADVRALHVANNLLYIGAKGTITLQDGTTANPVAAWDSQSWRPIQSSDGAPGPNGVSAAYAFSEVNGRLVAAGDFVDLNVQVSGVAQWTGTNWFPLANGLVGNVTFVQPFNGRFFVGGNFLRNGDMQTAHIMSWTGDGWDSLGNGLRSPATGATLFDGRLVVSGGSPVDLPPSAGSINAWNGASWESLGKFEAGNASQFAEYKGELIAAGSISPSASLNVRGIAAWNGSSWHAVGGECYGIRSLAVYGDKLIAAGAFATAAGVPVDNMAGWDGTSWSHVGGGATGPIDSVIVWNGRLIIGGQFTFAGDTPVVNAAAWDGTGTTWTPMNASSRVLQLLVYQGDLLARMQNQTNLKRWTGSDWADFPFSAQSIVGAGGGEMATATTSDGMSIGTHAFPRYVSGSPMLPTQPQDPLAYCGAPATMSVIADNVGDNTPSYRWRRGSTPIFDGPTRTGSTLVGTGSRSLTIENIGPADSGSYDVEVVNSCGSIISDAAQVTPNCCPADLNDDGFVDDGDLALFAASYNTMLCEEIQPPCFADFNRDGVVDDRDFQIFVQGYYQMVCE